MEALTVNDMCIIVTVTFIGVFFSYFRYWLTHKRYVIRIPVLKPKKKEADVVIGSKFNGLRELCMGAPHPMLNLASELGALEK